MEYIPRLTSDISPALALVQAGYLPSTPTNPALAFSLRSLELLHSLFRAMSSFSVQSFARLLADMHSVSKILRFMQ